jgi:rSAM/selenodomain-associated transferase 1
MTKVPIEGHVKTRLAKNIGKRQATELYKCFLMDILDTLKKIGVPVIIYYTPKRFLNKLTKVIGNDYQFIPQKGADLGERLYNGFEIANSLGYECAVALATDIPDIPQRILEDCIRRLEESQAIIGPCPDGGYYLIGLRLDQCFRDLFTDIAWGSNNVYRDTVERMKEIQVQISEQWHDIDSVENLSRLLKSKSATHTQKYLSKIRVRNSK